MKICSLLSLMYIKTKNGEKNFKASSGVSLFLSVILAKVFLCPAVEHQSLATHTSFHSRVQVA